MTERGRRKKTARTVSRRTPPRAKSSRKHTTARTSEADEPSLVTLLADAALELAGSAISLAAGAAGVPLLKSGQLRLPTPRQREAMRDAGGYLRDLRELAGLTLGELSEALDLTDHSLLKGVEQGTATLSFELILRLAALLARHDPIPFILRFVRTYNPDIWKVLEGWGIGKLPMYFERERQFVNILRQHDTARHLSDAGFADVLAFTHAAFEMSMHFAARHEGLRHDKADAAGR